MAVNFAFGSQIIAPTCLESTAWRLSISTDRTVHLRFPPIGRLLGQRVTETLSASTPPVMHLPTKRPTLCFDPARIGKLLKPAQSFILQALSVSA